MKLYLSSYKLGDDPQQLVDLVGKNKKAALISNSLDCYTDLERRKISTQAELDDLKGLGFDPEDVDLRTYFGKPEELSKKMNEFGLIWVRGGNTFILRRAMAESGFDKWLISQKDNNDLVYAGYSAGVCVLSPTLKGLELVDDPNVEAVGYKSGIIWNGLGLIDFVFAPHFESDHPESAMVTNEVEHYKKIGANYKALHDGEVIVMEI